MMSASGKVEPLDHGFLEEYMSTATTFPLQREPELLGQTVVVIGGSAGIGLETARRARAEGARLILTARNPKQLQRAASEPSLLGDELENPRK